MPFGDDSLNPTELILGRLPEELNGFALVKLLLPVEFGKAAELACAEYEKCRPSAVIMLGQAGGRSAITPEAVGRNMMNARIPDNAGHMPVNEPIERGGPEELYATLPLEDTVLCVRSLGLPAEISRDAGAYVCNSLLYSVLRHNGGSVPTGFIHVPFIREQVEGVSGREETPYMELEDIQKAITSVIGLITEAVGS